jgi:transposase
MGRPAKPFPEGSAEKLKLAMRKARTKWEYQRWLCLWLRASLRLTTREIATALDWSTSRVDRLVSAYLRQGDAALRGPGRSGPRRQYLKWDQELALLRELAGKITPDTIIPAYEVHDAYEKALGRPVDKSAIYRMLTRHGWRRQASGGVPLSYRGWAPSRFADCARPRT